MLMQAKVLILHAVLSMIRFSFIKVVPWLILLRVLEKQLESDSRT